MYDSEYEEKVRKQAVMQVRRFCTHLRPRVIEADLIGGIAGCYYVEEMGSYGSSLEAG
jgi:hypothetical protein